VGEWKRTGGDIVHEYHRTVRFSAGMHTILATRRLCAVFAANCVCSCMSHLGGCLNLPSAIPASMQNPVNSSQSIKLLPSTST
jgi:hypothetical protein